MHVLGYKGTAVSLHFTAYGAKKSRSSLAHFNFFLTSPFPPAFSARLGELLICHVTVRKQICLKEWLPKSHHKRAWENHPKRNARSVSPPKHSHVSQARICKYDSTRKCFRFCLSYAFHIFKAQSRGL